MGLCIGLFVSLAVLHSVLVSLYIASFFPAYRSKFSTTDLFFSLHRSLTPFSKYTNELLSENLVHTYEPNGRIQTCIIFPNKIIWNSSF